MPDWLFDHHVGTIMLLMMVVFVGGTWLGAILIRPLLRLLALKQPEWNGLVSAALSCFGVFYGLLLGLLAVAAYQNRSDVGDSVAGEALTWAGLLDEFEDVYPVELASNIKSDLQEYLRVTIEEDWPEQQAGRIPTAGSNALRKLLKRLRTFTPTNERETILHEKVLDLLEVARSFRRTRLYSVTIGLPGVLWYVVIIGAAINILFIYLFDLRFMNVLLLGGILAFFIATVIGLIVVLDRPLRGPQALSADPFRLVSDVMSSRPIGEGANP
ncbi:bestrophin-like domain [Paludisphaera rhizosphaerae]|uniref:bestrophin-like domain n=1 Tax=Paludisphaera rhizosphaerae TaxID=2711216 RepID=UPI0013EB4EBD|nr:DUF4239 domain-containing protein [Paludisphaera rhizosphaerae]